MGLPPVFDIDPVHHLNRFGPAVFAVQRQIADRHRAAPADRMHQIKVVRGNRRHDRQLRLLKTRRKLRRTQHDHILLPPRQRKGHTGEKILVQIALEAATVIARSLVRPPPDTVAGLFIAQSHVGGGEFHRLPE